VNPPIDVDCSHATTPPFKTSLVDTAKTEDPKGKESNVESKEEEPLLKVLKHAIDIPSQLIS